jgi:hypothetical protein
VQVAATSPRDEGGRERTNNDGEWFIQESRVKMTTQQGVNKGAKLSERVCVGAGQAVVRVRSCRGSDKNSTAWEGQWKGSSAPHVATFQVAVRT